jgi:hypothetical protein
VYGLLDNDVTNCFIVISGDTARVEADNNIKLWEFLGFRSGIVEVSVSSVQDMHMSTFEYETNRSFRNVGCQ